MPEAMLKPRPQDTHTHTHTSSSSWHFVRHSADPHSRRYDHTRNRHMTTALLTSCRPIQTKHARTWQRTATKSASNAQLEHKAHKAYSDIAARNSQQPARNSQLAACSNTARQVSSVGPRPPRLGTTWLGTAFTQQGVRSLLLATPSFAQQAPPHQAAPPHHARRTPLAARRTPLAQVAARCWDGRIEENGLKIWDQNESQKTKK